MIKQIKNLTAKAALNWIIILIISLVSCKPDKPRNNFEMSGLPDPGPIDSVQQIVFFGNSLTAGYGLEPEQAYPALIQTKLDSMQLDYKVINAGLSGETSATGMNRIGWILKQPVHVFVLELGANDGLRGLPVEQTKKNLMAIIDSVQAKFSAAKIILAGMQVPPNMGAAYANSFQKIFPEIAKAQNVMLVPFLLEGVGGEAELNQADGIHPTAAGQKILAENVWKVLKEEL